MVEVTRRLPRQSWYNRGFLIKPFDKKSIDLFIVGRLNPVLSFCRHWIGLCFYNICYITWYKMVNCLFHWIFCIVSCLSTETEVSLLTGSWSKMPHLMSERSSVVLGRLQFWTWSEAGDTVLLIRLGESIREEMVASPTSGDHSGFWSWLWWLLV